MTSGKRYWSDGTFVAGQRFEYTFDDIGNRKTAASGGDQYGANLRYQNYSASSLNQYTQRTVPPYVDVQGSATNTATVTVNLQPTHRKGDYFRAELSADNSSAPLWFAITNVAVLPNGTNADIVTTNQGNILVAKASEAFLYDLDGNLKSDSLWTNTWNGENRLIATESASGVPSAGKEMQTWTYLPDGRWIQRVIYSWNSSAYVAQSTNRFVWDGQVLVAIVDHTNGLVASFARGLDLSGSLQGAGGVGGVLAVNIVTNGVHFAAFDGNGNISALVSATNAAVTANYEYSPFGETLRAGGVIAKANPIRFSTQFADDVTGDLKYLFRETKPSWGRWLSRDPIRERGGIHLYAMTKNSPLNFFDPLGLLNFISKKSFVHGTHGSWIFDMKTQGSGLSSDSEVEAVGTIAFFPNSKATTGSDGKQYEKCPDCKLIRLVQIIRIHETPGQLYDWTGDKRPMNAIKTAEDVSHNILGGFSVDHLPKVAAKTAASIYYRDYVPNNSQDGSMIAGKKSESASLYDAPVGNPDDIFEFETCARCVDSSSLHDKQYLGCLRWGFTVDKGRNLTFMTPSATDTASPTFIQAVGNFNAYYGTKH